MRPRWLQRIDSAYQAYSNNTREMSELLQKTINEIDSPANYEWKTIALKRELYEFKSMLEDAYDQLPNFGDEDIEWEKERMYNKLKKRIDE